MNALGGAGTRRLLAVVAVVVLVVTAGCAGLSPGQAGDNTTDSGTPDDQGEDETDSGTNSSDDPTDNDSSTGGSETNIGTFGDLDPAETDVTAEQLLAQSADRLAEVESYRLEQEILNVQQQNNQERTVRVNQTARVDRAQQRIAAQGTTNLDARSVSVRRYLLNDSLYESSEQIAQQFGSEWVQTNISGQFEQIFEQFDSARQVEPLFRNATATVEGQTTIDGQRVYAINATINSTAVVETRQNIDGAEQFQLNVWLSAENSLPLQVAEDSTVTISSGAGELTQQTDSVIRYQFEDVEITLPSAAEDAPLTSDLTNQ